MIKLEEVADKVREEFFIIEGEYRNIADKIEGTIDNLISDLCIITLTRGLCKMRIPIVSKMLDPIGVVDANVYYLASDLAAIAASATLCDINQVPVSYDTRISVISHQALKSLTISAGALKSGVANETQEAEIIESIVNITDKTGKLVAKAKSRYQIEER